MNPHFSSTREPLQVESQRMKYWITKLAIYTVLLYHLLLENSYAQADQLANIDLQGLNTASSS